MSFPYRPGFPGDLPLRPSNQLQLDWFATTRNMIHLWLPEAIRCDHGLLFFLLQSDICFQYKPVDGGGWQHMFRMPELLECAVTVHPVSEGIEMKLSLTNLSECRWCDVSAASCTQFHAAPDFYDPERRRTFYLSGGELQTLQGPVKSSGEGACLFYGHQHLEDYPAPDSGLVVIESGDSRFVAALWWEGATTAWGNAHPATLCIHADPEFGEIAPGKTVTRTGRLYLMRGNREDALARFAASSPV